MMNDEQKQRYSRHILLHELGHEGQEKIASSHALVIGAGGLGSPASFYLASGGFGKITLVDKDQVELTNLPAPDPAHHRPDWNEQGAVREKKRLRKSIRPLK